MQRTLLLARSLRAPTPLRQLSTSASRREAASPELLSYFVARSASGQLPCYGEVKNGGQRYETVIRKIDGNIEDLRRDLGQFLDDVPSYTKPQSRQIVLRGDWTKEVKEWLSARGF